MSVFFSDKDITFMNYGYETYPNDGLKLDPSDEPNRYYIQLYDHVCKTIDLKDKTILEISCGRGGAADWIYRTYKPTRYTGLDLSIKGINVCKRLYERDELSFVVGDALHLPFKDGEFDIVINVEASHCYPDQARFFNEVSRVLTPKGVFLYTDFRPDTNYEKWFHSVKNNSNFRLVSVSDITEQVYFGTLMNSDKHAKLSKKLPWVLQYFGKRFSGCEGTYVNLGFKNKTIRYTSFVLTRKR